jgi:DNA polymerase elongation subunit (family B)
MLITNYYEKDNRIYFIGRDTKGNRVRHDIDAIEPYYFDKDNNKIEGEPNGKAFGYYLNKLNFTRVINKITNYYDFNNMKTTEEKVIPRICNIDIEIDDKSGFPDIKLANQKVLCYVMYDNYTDYYYIHGLDKADIEKLADKIGHLKFKFFVHETEADMINWFFKYLNSNQAPDYIVGYNVEFFDMKYLKNRGKALGLELNLNGAVIFDLEKGYMHIKHNEPSYKLDDIAKKELGYGKIPREEVWKMNPLDRYYYCYFDVFLTNELDKKLKIFDYHMNIALITNVHIKETFYPTTFVYSALMYANDEDIKFPINTNVKEEDNGETIEGGFVVEPSEGIFQSVICIDVKSSYPRVILTKNISFENIIYDEDNNPIGFSTEKEGLLPKVIRILLESRDKLKVLMKNSTDPNEKDGYNSIQYALKTVTNAFYGVFVSVAFKLYDPFVAASITEGGRENINRMVEYLQEKNYILRYGDTDSVFISAKTDNVEEEGKQLQNDINQMFNEKNGKNNYVEVEFEKYYSSWLQTGVKKRYAGYIEYPKKELQIKGFEVIRRGNSKYTKEIQKKFIELLLTDVPKAFKFYNDEDKRWNKKAVPLSKIGIEKTMRKDESEYKSNNDMLKAIRNAEKRGIKIDMLLGKMRIYYLENGEPIAIPMDADIPKSLKIDYEQHKIKCFESPLEKLKNLLGEQKKLDDFFV